MITMQAYQDTGAFASLKSPRDSESDVFLMVTRRLKSGEHNKASDFTSYVSAISENRKLWTLVSTDVLHQKNALPSQTKASILYLNDFVQLYSGKVLSEGLPVDPLIDINLSIIRGLNENRAMT